MSKELFDLIITVKDRINAEVKKPKKKVKEDKENGNSNNK